MKINSLSEIATLADHLPTADAAMREGARAHQDALTKPPGSLGRLERSGDLHGGGGRATARPEISKAQALVFAGNHGVCAQGVNPYPQSCYQRRWLANFEHGGAAINQLCRANDADLSVIALDLDTPTADFTHGPAMTEAETLDAMNRGAAAVDPGVDVVILGEMGIGNSTIAAALASALFVGTPGDWVGPGTGSDADGLARKIAAITTGLALHGAKSPMEILAALGGREQAAICGAVLGARAQRIPVILDGFICTSAAATLYAADPRLLNHCLVGHVSAEPGHRRLLGAIDKRAVLEFDMRLGEGSGAALALGILRSALACHNGMATFAQAGISEA